MRLTDTTEPRFREDLTGLTSRGVVFPLGECPPLRIDGREIGRLASLSFSWTPPTVRRLSAGSAEGAKGGTPDAGQGVGS